MIGFRVGTLTVISAAGRRNNSLLWEVRCDCGSLGIRRGINLRGAKKEGRHSSCAECRRRKRSEDCWTHGMTHHRAYSVWANMKNRCLNPECLDYKNYGGRGIQVCQRWQDSFQNFWDDVKDLYRPRCQIDRVDNNAHYEPGNVHWVKRITNRNNTRTNRVIDTPKGRMTVAQASRWFGINGATLRGRIKRGVAPEHWFDALNRGRKFPR